MTMLTTCAAGVAAALFLLCLRVGDFVAAYEDRTKLLRDLANELMESGINVS
jgi:hypothetical protein